MSNGLNNLSWQGEWSALSGKQRHLMQLGAGDKVLGAILDRLQSLGALDNSLIVVTADHGVAFDAGEPVRGVSQANAAEIAWTPLFVKYPLQRGGRIDDRPAQSIDVAPTILDTIGLQSGWKFDGVSLQGPPREEFPRRLLDWNLNTARSESGSHSVTVDPARFADILRMRAWPGSGDAETRLYQIGPYGGLLGQTVASLPRGPEIRASAAVDEPGPVRNVNITSPVVSFTEFRGHIDGVAPDTALVIAVNGRVAAFASAFAGDAQGKSPRNSWWARAPIDSFRPGANTVTLYIAKGPPDSPTLSRVTLR
jgi:hypothetical protein